MSQSMRYNVPLNAWYYGWPIPPEVLKRCVVCGREYFSHWEYNHDDYCSNECWTLAEVMEYEEAMDILMIEWGIHQCRLWCWMNKDVTLIYRLLETFWGI